jgi:hypothetical protein
MTSSGEPGQLARAGCHCHHLKAINTIRSCGGLAAASGGGGGAGVPREGMFQACVQHAVPVVLAGSIRDDGPLPDTEMDLIRVQAAYAEALRGGEMR